MTKTCAMVSEPGGTGLAARRLLHYALMILAWLAVAVYVFCVIIQQTGTWTWAYGGLWADLRKITVIEYSMDQEDDPKLIDGWELWGIMFGCLPIAVAAVAVAAAVWLGSTLPRNTSAPAKTANLMCKMKQVCYWQLPPRRFWLNWCDGLTVLEAFLVAAFAALHIILVNDLVVYYSRQMDAWGEAGLYYNCPKYIYRLEWIAISWGWMVWVDLALLFCPISHNSFLNYITGLPYSALVRFHRWIGHFTMISTSLHGLFYYLLWLSVPEYNFWEEALDWNTKSTINFLAGSIAWLFGIILWVTAVERVRRRAFEVFYKTHIFGFLGYLVFGMIHFWWNWVVLVPAFALYCADLVTRLCQAQNMTVAMLACPGGDPCVKGACVAVDIPISQDIKLAAGQDMYLLAPSISRWQWHPFTVATVEDGGAAQATQSGDAKDVHVTAEGPVLRCARLCIKAAGSWTQELVAQLQISPVPLRVIGPFGGLHMDEYMAADALLLIAGGIGVAPLLAIARELLLERTSGKHPVPKKVKLVWVARHAEEFVVLDETLAQATSAEPDWMSLSLHCTSLATCASPAGSGKKKSHTNNLLTTGQVTGCPLPEIAGQLSAAGTSLLMTARMSSGFLWCALRPMQPQVHSMTERCFILLLTLLGGFMGVVLAQSMYNEWSAIPGYDEPTYPPMAVVYLIVLGVQMMGLPMALWVFPKQLCRYIKDTKNVSLSASELASTTFRMPTLVDGSMLVYHETGVPLPIAAGRPNLGAAITWAEEAGSSISNKTSSAAAVRVACAGPSSLNHTVQELVCKHNDQHGLNMHLDYVTETYEL